MKPGYLTTEFWTVVVSYIFGGFVFLTGGKVSSQDLSPLVQPIAQLAVAVIMIAAQVAYIYSRTIVKKADIENSVVDTTSEEETTSTTPVGQA